MNYPKWKCHKVVEAAKIEHIAGGHGGEAGLMFSRELGARRVSEAWMFKHEPRVGGYWVRYEDGYESYSPAEAFEAGYTRMTEEKGEGA